jgi:hypothetical protein
MQEAVFFMLYVKRVIRVHLQQSLKNCIIAGLLGRLIFLNLFIQSLHGTRKI